MAGQGKLKKTHWLKRAQALFQSAQFKTALDLLEANPQRAALPRAVLLKGKILAAMGNTEAAVKTWISCRSLPLAGEENQGQLRRERGQITARALILAGQTLWLEKTDRSLNTFPVSQDMNPRAWPWPIPCNTS